MRKTLLALAGLLVALPATALAQHDHHAKHDEIAAVTASWEKAFNAGDAAGVAALYTDDAALMPPGAEAVVGMEAIQAFWSEFIASGATVKIETKEVSGSGDMLVEIGTVVVTAPDGSHADHGPFLVVYKNVDGKWKMHRDIWNSSME